MGLFNKLVNLGVAYAQTAAKQKLQSMAENARAAQTGQPQTTPARNDSAPDLSLDDTVKLIAPCDNLPPQECLAMLRAKLAGMGDRQRQQFAGHMLKVLEGGRKQLQFLKDNEANAWGSYFEDRAAYQSYKLRTGGSDPAYAKKIEQAQQGLRTLETIAEEAANSPAPAPQPVPQPKPTTSPAAPPAAASDDSATRIRRERMDQKMRAQEFDAEFFALLEEDRQASLASGQISADKDFATQEALAEVRQLFEQSQGQVSPTQSVAGTKRTMTQRQELLSTAGHHLIADNPESCARALALLPYLKGLKLPMLNLETLGEQTTATRLQLMGRVSNVVAHLAKLKDDAAVIAFEHHELRTLAMAIRDLIMLPHLTVARPLWACPPREATPNGIFFSGADDARQLLAQVCKEKQLDLGAKVRVQNYGQARWEALRESVVAVFDWRQYKRDDPAAQAELAAVAYEQGLAIALGTPTVVLANDGQTLPFDIEIEPLFLSGSNKKADQATLETALDAALYESQRRVDKSGLPATIEWLRKSLAGHERQNFFETQGWLDPEQARDPVNFSASVGQLITYWGEDPPVAMFPAWPVEYPADDAAAGKRLFHVMPFTQPWSDEVANAAKGTCKKVSVIYERGDSSADVRIVNRVWKGICSADFVLVDTTGLNPNVMLELGIAHALGRNALLVQHSDEVGTVRNLEKIEIKRYANTRALKTLVGKWLIQE